MSEKVNGENGQMTLPSRYQVGEAVYVAATVDSVTFNAQGEVNYGVAIGTTANGGLCAPTQVVRSYDVEPRVVESAAKPEVTP